MINSVLKHSFRIRTRGGVIVDNLSIAGQSEDAATKKLMQMYPGCEILNTRVEAPPLGPSSSSFEEVVDLITPPRENDPCNVK